MTQSGPETAGPGQILARAAADAARLMRMQHACALATLDAASGLPYVSLVTVALDDDGAPLLLIWRLARHTQNLDADPRSSLLFTPTGIVTGDPLAAARVTVMGTLAPTRSPTARVRFLASHPEAEMYAGFADFCFFAMARVSSSRVSRERARRRP